MKGALHVHSTYSDGELCLGDLRREYLRLGYSFACLADHAEYFDAERVAAYRDECEKLSDEMFRFVPGLEYECPGRMHILGLGTTELFETRDPQAVIHAISRGGGVSVIAHPRTNDFAAIEALDHPAMGIEVWNSKYDGRYAPRLETFALARRIRFMHPHVNAFYGQDLHFHNQYMGLHVRLFDSSLHDDDIIQALRAGAYCAGVEELELGADGVLDPVVARRFERAQLRSRKVRRVVGQAKALLDRAGIGVPPVVKAQLRRLF